MNPSRTILHLDLDAFFCAVEENRNPDLQGKPFAVGGDPRKRGVVSSCSYAAREFGVHSAMPMARALELCPDLIVVSPKHQVYTIISRKVMRILHQRTDQVEELSIDEAFLDITDLPGKPLEIGRQLQRDIQETLNLPSSLGIASNKLVAKIATDVGKLSASGPHPPNAITRVPPGQKAEFLAPLPVDMLWGVGPKTRERLHSLGIQTIGELADYPRLELAQQLGKHGYDLSRRAQGIDQRPIVTERTVKSISNEHTFSVDKSRRSELLKEFKRLSRKVGSRLQKKNLRGRTIQIKIRWSDFTTHTRQRSLSRAVNDPDLIFEESKSLFDGIWEPGQSVRLVGVGVSNLDTKAQQLQLWSPQVKKDLRLQETLEALQEKFGKDIISQGLKRNPPSS